MGLNQNESKALLYLRTAHTLSPSHAIKYKLELNRGI